MNCPKCFEPLRIAERQGIEIDYCPECRGVWLDHGELDKIIERTVTFTHPHTPPRYAEEEKHYKKDKYSEKEYKKYKEYKKKKKKAKHFLEEIFDIFD